MKGYRDLIVWQKSVDFVRQIYQLTSRFPEDEKFGLSLQLRRAAISIPSNIAEGQSRKSRKEFVRFLLMARGSVSEIDTQLFISQSLNYINSSDSVSAVQNTQEIGKMINGLIRSLQSESSEPKSPD